MIAAERNLLQDGDMEDELRGRMNDLATELWPHIIDEIDSLTRYGEERIRPAPPKTSIATDDQRTRPYQTSHAVQQCLAAGIDNLSGLRHMIFGAPGETPAAATIHQSAHYLLARGAIENFATGLWILGPRARPERVTRTMRWHAQNVKDMHNAIDPLPVESSTTTREEKFESIEAIVRAAGGTAAGLRKGYTATEVVKYTDELVTTKNEALTTLFVWRLCSGFAHGRPWASLGFLEREEIATDDPEILHARMTSDLPRALMAPQHALKLCNRLLALYSQRCTPITPFGNAAVRESASTWPR